MYLTMLCVSASAGLWTAASHQIQCDALCLEAREPSEPPPIYLPNNGESFRMWLLR